MDYKSGIIAQIPDFDFNIHFEIIDYQVLIVGDDKTTFTAKNNGAWLQSYILQRIGSMKANDKIIIDDIHCVGPDKKVQKLNPIIITFN